MEPRDEVSLKDSVVYMMRKVEISEEGLKELEEWYNREICRPVVEEEE